jgi:hypothetical protein
MFLTRPGPRRLHRGGRWCRRGTRSVRVSPLADPGPHRRRGVRSGPSARPGTAPPTAESSTGSGAERRVDTGVVTRSGGSDTPSFPRPGPRRLAPQPSTLAPEVPPQMPACSPWASASSRHSSCTGQPAQTALARAHVTFWPRDGKNAAVLRPRHAASACRDGRNSSTRSGSGESPQVMSARSSASVTSCDGNGPRSVRG